MYICWPEKEGCIHVSVEFKGEINKSEGHVVI